MIEQCGPSTADPTWLKAFLIIMNAFQAIGVAYVVQRAARKNREERNGKEHKAE